MKPMPTCYRHPDRPTRLSCGRCGKPLCADCVQHGPVGIRCRECLQPVRGANTEFGPPHRVGLALAAGAVLAVLWVAIFIGLGLYLGVHGEDLPLEITLVFAPNLLLSGLAGGLVGWIIWRICGRTCNRTTIIVAVSVAAAIPLLSTLALGAVAHFIEFSGWMLILRVLAAMALSAAFSFLLTTQIHWSGLVHLDE